MELLNKESKPVFNFAGLQDRGLGLVKPVKEEPVKKEPVSKSKGTVKIDSSFASGTKKLVLNKPKY